MTKTITLLGTQITVRKPAEGEAIALEDKRQQSRAYALQEEDEAPRDYLDDGDNEVMVLVTSPDLAALKELLEYAPLAIQRIEDVARALGEEAVRLTPAPDLVAAAKGVSKGRFVGFWIGEGDPADRALLALGRALTTEEQARADKAQALVPLTLRCIDRVRWKFFQREQRPAIRRLKRVPLPALVALTKEHVHGEIPAGLWDRFPFLSMALSDKLYLAARGDEGK